MILLHAFGAHPIVETVVLLVVLLTMNRAWLLAGHSPMETDSARRQTAANAITTQVNAAATMVSIVLAGVGAALTIGYDKLPRPAMIHLGYAEFWSILSIGAGIYILGYMCSPTVIEKINVSKKKWVQLTLLAQFMLIYFALVRFALAIAYLVHLFPAPKK